MSDAGVTNMRRLLAATTPRVQTGTCSRCGKPIFNKRADAKSCSAKCRTRAWRERHPAPGQPAEVQALEAELGNLREEVKALREENATLRARFGVDARSGLVFRAKTKQDALKASTVAVADKYIKVQR